MQIYSKKIMYSVLLCVLILFTGCNSVEDKSQGNIKNAAKEPTSISAPLVKTDDGKWATQWGLQASLPLGKNAMSLKEGNLNEPLDENLINDLAFLGRVWGFNKYYHPQVRSGKLDWDRELIGLLPTFLARENRTEREALLLEWINALGPLENEMTNEIENTPPNHGLVLSPDLQWIEKEVHSKALQEKLIAIQKIKRGNQSAYVNLTKILGADFSKEKTYYGVKSEDHLGMRMLTLFRIWNAYQYFSPYKDLSDLDWNLVLTQHIEPFVMAQSNEDFEIANLKLMKETGDGHVNIVNYNISIFGQYIAPLEVVWLDGQWLLKGPLNPSDQMAWEAFENLGLSPGDQILSVNKVSCDDLYEKYAQILTASTEPSKRLNFAKEHLLRSNLKDMTLTIMRDGKTLEVAPSLVAMKDFQYDLWSSNPRYPAFKELNNQVSYINFGQFNQALLDTNRETILNSQTVILDLRGYGRDHVLFDLIPMLMNEETLGANFSLASVQNPGTFIWSEPEIYTPTHAGKFKGDLVALIDESSLSQPEYMSMFVKAMPNGTLVGKVTAGADGNVSLLPLPTLGKMTMTGIGVYNPDKSPTQRIGILPDIPVTQTIKAIKEGRDEIMEAAADLVQCPELLNIQITK